MGAASPAEIRLLEPTLATIRVPRSGPGRPKAKPQRVIGDKAYDSDGHRRRLARQGIELIAPRRGNRRKTHDGRSLRRCHHRWRIERTLSWLG